LLTILGRYPGRKGSRKWDEGPAAKESSAELHKLFLAMRQAGGVVRNDGDAIPLRGSPKKSKQPTNFPSPRTLHGAMNCTVQIRPDGAEAWCPRKRRNGRKASLRAAKLPPEK